MSYLTKEDFMEIAKGEVQSTLTPKEKEALTKGTEAYIKMTQEERRKVREENRENEL